MAQFLYPISDVTNTFSGGGFASIDEVTPSDTDYAYGTNNSTTTLECALTATGISDPLSSTGHTVYWRQSQADHDAGTPAPSSGGSNSTYDVLLIQGTTTIATCASGASASDGSFAAGSYTLSAAEANSITDYTDLRIRMVSIGTGGTPSGRRAVAFSSAYLEIPDAPASTNLVVQETAHGLTSDVPTLTHKYTLSASETAHGVTSDAPTLTHKYSLSVSETAHGLVSDNVTLDLSVTIVVQDAAHGLSSEAPTLTHKYSLSVSETAHGLISDNAALTHAYSLSVSEAAHGLISDNVTLDLSTQIPEAQEAFHGLTSDSPTLTHKYSLFVNDTAHGLTSDEPTLTHKYSLSASDTAHGLTSDNVTFSFGETLVVSDCFHGLASDNVVTTWVKRNRGRTQVQAGWKSLNDVSKITTGRSSANNEIAQNDENAVIITRKKLTIRI